MCGILRRACLVETKENIMFRCVEVPPIVLMIIKHLDKHLEISASWSHGTRCFSFNHVGVDRDNDIPDRILVRQLYGWENT